MPRKIVLMSLFALSEFRNVPRADLASYKVVTLSLSIMHSETKQIARKECYKQVLIKKLIISSYKNFFFKYTRNQNQTLQINYSENYFF